MADHHKSLAPKNKTGEGRSACVRSSTWSDYCPISSLDFTALQGAVLFLPRNWKMVHDDWLMWALVAPTMLMTAGVLIMLFLI